MMSTRELSLQTVLLLFTARKSTKIPFELHTTTTPPLVTLSFCHKSRRMTLDNNTME